MLAVAAISTAPAPARAGPAQPARTCAACLAPPTAAYFSQPSAVGARRRALARRKPPWLPSSHHSLVILVFLLLFGALCAGRPRRHNMQPAGDATDDHRTSIARRVRARIRRARAWLWVPASLLRRPPERPAWSASLARLLLLAYCSFVDARPRSRVPAHSPLPLLLPTASELASGAALAASVASAAGIAVGIAALAISAARTSPDPSSNLVEAQSVVVATSLTEAPTDFSCSPSIELTACDPALQSTRSRRRRHRGPLAAFPAQEAEVTPFALFPTASAVGAVLAGVPAMAAEDDEPMEADYLSKLSSFAEKDLVENLTVNHILPAVARYRRLVAVAGGADHSERAAAALHARLLRLLDRARLDARAGRSYTWFYASLAASIPHVQPNPAAEAARCAAILAQAAEIRAAADARRAAHSAPPAATAAVTPLVDPVDWSEEEDLEECFGSRRYDDAVYGDGGYARYDGWE